MIRHNLAVYMLHVCIFFQIARPKNNLQLPIVKTVLNFIVVFNVEVHKLNYM